MDLGKKQKRNRLIALSFASVLLLLIYGPLAQWFVVADRVLYDTLASSMPNKPLEKAVIVSLDPSEHSDAEPARSNYGEIVDFLHKAEVKRIIMPNPPEIAASETLPSWTSSLGESVPVYVPTNHRFGELRTRRGFMSITPDSDGVLRRSDLWQLSDGVMSPSLPLAIAFDNDETQVSHRMSSDEDAIYLSNYPSIRRLDADDISRRLGQHSRNLVGYTVFLDSEPELVGAQGQLPSGQFVTSSEIVGTLLANVEQDRAIIAPSAGFARWNGWHRYCSQSSRCCLCRTGRVAILPSSQLQSSPACCSSKQ